jgi:hypothetical protein
VCLYPPTQTFQCLNQSLWNLLCTVYHDTWAHLNGVLHIYLSSVCASVWISDLSLLGNGSVNTFPRQRIHATIELLDASFSVRSASYQRRVCGSVYPAVIGQRLGKHVPAATNNCCRRFLCSPCLIKAKRVISSSKKLFLLCNIWCSCGCCREDTVFWGQTSSSPVDFVWQNYTKFYRTIFEF